MFKSTSQCIVFLAAPLLLLSTMLPPAFAAPAVGFKTVVNFTNDFGDPISPLIRATDGKFYGVTQGGGPNGGGAVFKINAAGALTIIYSFCALPDCADGVYPLGGVIQATDGNFYGTTNGSTTTVPAGTVFKLTPTGVLTTLHTFCAEPNCTDGAFPEGELVQTPNGNIYGTTLFGGTNRSGTLFRVTPSGTLTTLYNFCSLPNCADGAYPNAVIQATDGNLYGTALGGGSIFRFTSDGVFTTLYTFCSQPNCTDGANPEGGLMQAADGNFYGTTVVGGTGFNGACRGTCGTVFKFTPDGVLTTLHDFVSSDGRFPEGGLIQATDGNFYGTTSDGGPHGTVFKIAADGTFTTLWRFNITNGTMPAAALLQSPGGNLWGTTSRGGSGNAGTLFTLNAGLGPFVQMSPLFGTAGTSVTLLGIQMKGTTSVTFNGLPATFQVISNAAIKTTVPSGATTGPVVVTTPSGTLTSNVNFQVD